MQKRLFAIISLLALLATACGGGGKQTTGGGGKSASPTAKEQTFHVDVDGKSDKFNLAATAFFPKELSVHPGDTVEFKEHFSGEPHTVTFGKLVEAGLAAADKMQGGAPGGGGSPAAGATGATPGASASGSASAAPSSSAGPTASASASASAGASQTGGASPSASESGAAGGEEGAPPPEMQKLPDIFGPPPTFAPLNQSAGQPCFLETGDPPAPPKGGGEACPKVEQPDFNGNQTFFNSGYLENDQTFKMKFSPDITPGTYRFMCLVHREGMQGKVTVAPAGTDIPSPDEASNKGKEEFSKTEQSLNNVYEDMEKATADKAFAGGGSPQVMDAIVAEFGPEEISIPTGGTVSWNVFSFHTIALNAPEDAINIFSKDSDGTVKLNPKVGAPSKAPPPPKVEEGPGGRPSTTQASYDGEGFFNSGVMGGFPGSEVTYKIRFTKAGTYQLQCGIHPDMKGTVKVG